MKNKNDTLKKAKEEDVAFITIRGEHKKQSLELFERMLSNKERYKPTKISSLCVGKKFWKARRAHIKWFLLGLKEADGKCFDTYVRATDDSFIIVKGREMIDFYLK